MMKVDPALIQIAELAIKISKIDFGIPNDGGFRTADQQYKLAVAGKSKCDGYKVKSFHQKGKALDFYAYVDGKASWDEYHLAMIATAFLQAASLMGHRLEWGGNFKNFKDFPHVQLA